MDELGLNQRELIERSQVSRATVGEIRRNEAQRRRSARTLEALSIALDWHPQHLSAVLQGRHIPQLGEPVARSDDDIPGRLAAIEYMLQQIAKKLEASTRWPTASRRSTPRLIPSSTPAPRTTSESGTEEFEWSFSMR